MFSIKGKWWNNFFLSFFLVMSVVIFVFPEGVHSACNTAMPYQTFNFAFCGGTAAINCSGGLKVNVQIGDEVRAFVDSVPGHGGCVGQFTVTTAGSYGALSIYADDPSSAEKDGVVVNDTIRFTICHNGIEYSCDQTYLWDGSKLNDFIELNLTAPGPAAPEANFTPIPAKGCAPLQVTFTNSSTNADSCEWNFGDGNESTVCSPTHTYLQAGTYSVTLTITNVCGEDSETKNVIVQDPTIADFSADANSGCAPLQVTFTNKSVNAESYLWTFGDGQTSTETSPIHAYTQAGTYTVTLTVTNECGDSTKTEENYIVVASAPTAAFIATPPGGLAPLQVTFTNNSTNADSYVWNFGDGNTSTAVSPTHTYIQEGTYTVTLKATNNCGDDTETKNIVVWNKPVPDFSADPNSGCAPLLVPFTNKSTNADSYLWAFGDGQTSTATSPTHTYTQKGEYTVTLTATNESGDIPKTIVKYIVVDMPPIALFTGIPTGGCAPLQVTFINSSINADRYEWSFGDGNTSTVFEPIYTYTNAGQYTVTLKAYNNLCEEDFDEKTEVEYIVVVSNPVADFSASPTSGCLPLQVTFTNNSSGADHYEWEFGDGNTSTATAPTYTYPQQGEYTVTLKAFNNLCDEPVIIAKQEYITVKAQPIADFIPSPIIGPMPLTVTFHDTSQNNPTVWNWDFGDGLKSTEQDPNHTYQNPGQYTVTLTVSNESCTSLAKTRNIIVLRTTSPTGRVLDQETETGIENALVSIRRAPQLEVLTDVSGAYTLANLPLGNYKLEVSAEGYATEFAEFENREETTQIPDIKLTKKVGILSGKVYEKDDLNHPISGAAVIAHRKVNPHAVNKLMKEEDSALYTRKAKTDQNGEFIIYVSKEGQYNVSAFANGYFPEKDSNSYMIDPEDPESRTAEDINIGLRKKPMGPKIRVSSYEWQDAETGDNSTKLFIFIDTNAPSADPDVTIQRLDESGIGIFNPLPPQKVLGDEAIGTHYQTEFINYAGHTALKKVKIQVSAGDVNGTTTIIYIFMVNPAIHGKPSNIGGTGNGFTPVEGLTGNEVGLIDLDGDGIYDGYDNSFIGIPPFGIASEGDPNFAMNELTIRIDRLGDGEGEMATALYDVYMLDSDGNRITNFVVDADNPITVYLHFDPESFDGNLANLIIKYQAADGTWKTDGISNLRIEDRYIIFDVIHLTPFSAFTDSAPTNLSARQISTSQVSLTWIDNSIDEFGFQIWRWVNNADPNATTTYQMIATVDPNITTYTDANCTVNTTYYYAVRAFNQFGSTDPSNLVSVTMLPSPPPAGGGKCDICFIAVVKDSVSSPWHSLKTWFLSLW